MIKMPHPVQGFGKDMNFQWYEVILELMPAPAARFKIFLLHIAK
jgi:hypothetical protein